MPPSIRDRNRLVKGLRDPPSGSNLSQTKALNVPASLPVSCFIVKADVTQPLLQQSRASQLPPHLAIFLQCPLRLNRPPRGTMAVESLARARTADPICTCSSAGWARFRRESPAVGTRSAQDEQTECKKHGPNNIFVLLRLQIPRARPAARGPTLRETGGACGVSSRKKTTSGTGQQLLLIQPLGTSRRPRWRAGDFTSAKSTEYEIGACMRVSPAEQPG